MQTNITIEKKKQMHNKSPFQLKTTYPFIKGIPSASNWSNHFTSLVFPGGKFLLYISNSFIIVLDLIKKNFHQVLSSYKILPKEKPNILILLNNQKFLSVLNSGEIISFRLDNESYFFEDLNTNKLGKVCQNAKCGIFDTEQNILILSNENAITNYFLQCGENYNLFKIYQIENINTREYFITDMILIKIELNNYLAVSNNIGKIIIYQYDTIKYKQMLIINNNKIENIYNIIYDNNKKLLFSINRSGTLDIYQLIKEKNNHLTSYNMLSLINKFNDQTINEFYLYFSISFIKDDNSSNILVTSNNGRIFIYNMEYNEFKEVAENPHKNSIYSILINKDTNQIIFFSSDYKISLFDIINKENKSQFSINFLTCINTIPSKVKLLKQIFSKIYFLYQIQHQLYISSYDFKKEKNSLDTLQNKVKIKHDNKGNNGLIKEFSSNNYILNLCKLIDEERILLINKNNEIIIYNIDNEEIERNLLFIKNDELIIDTLFENNILYILYKSGRIIIYDYITKKIEKYKVSNFIDKGNLLFIQYGTIIITIKEFKSELVTFYLLKNYIFIKLKEIIVPNNFYSYQFIKPDVNLFYFYAFEEDLKVFNMNLINQFNILKDIGIKEINYEKYLDTIDKMKNSLSNINEENYEFDSVFQRSDVNKNNLKLTNISINEKYNMICSFSDGSIMYYIIDITMNSQNYYVINKIIYKYLIKVNFLPINDALFINNISNNSENNYCFVTTSAEQSLKITDPSNCNILNINFKPESNNSINQEISKDIIINKSFTNLFSNLFFAQSTKEAKEFSENFSLPENMNNDISIEILLYSYFKDDKEKNLTSIQKIIEYANNKIKLKKQNTKYIEEICNYFSQKEKNNDKLIFVFEKDYNKIIDALIEFYCYVECLLFVKYKNLGLDAFIQCLEKIKKSIYIKQLFQAIKIEKIIEYYKRNFNIISD